jgi:hypothetical protein
MVTALVLLCLPAALAQTVPEGWSVIHDSRHACQIAVPPDWSPLSEAAGAAVFHDASNAIAVVTSQPGQTFKPLSEALIKGLDIRRDKLFENSPKRVFYQDRFSRNQDDPNAYSASVPGKGGTCSCHVTFMPGVAEDVVRKIALSLSPAAPSPAHTDPMP